MRGTPSFALLVRLAQHRVSHCSIENVSSKRYGAEPAEATKSIATHLEDAHWCVYALYEDAEDQLVLIGAFDGWEFESDRSVVTYCRDWSSTGA